jgi:hypothetical protein
VRECGLAQPSGTIRCALPGMAVTAQGMLLRPRRMKRYASMVFHPSSGQFATNETNI